MNVLFALSRHTLQQPLRLGLLKILEKLSNAVKGKLSILILRMIAHIEKPYRCARGCGKTFLTEKGASRHVNSSSHCVTTTQHFRKKWDSSSARFSERRFLLGLKRHSKYSDRMSSELGSELIEVAVRVSLVDTRKEDARSLVKQDEKTKRLGGKVLGLGRR